MQVSLAGFEQKTKKRPYHFFILNMAIAGLFTLGLFLICDSKSDAGEIFYNHNSSQTKNQFTDKIVLVDDSGEPVVIPDSYCETAGGSDESSSDQSSERNVSKFSLVANCGFAVVNNVSFPISHKTHIKYSSHFNDNFLTVSNTTCTNLQRAPPIFHPT
jgi:hypothetical protein